MRGRENIHTNICMRSSSDVPSPTALSPRRVARVALFGCPRPLAASPKFSLLVRGCRVVGGLEIAVCPAAGVAWAGVALSLRELCSLGERDKGDGERGICCSSRLAQTAQAREGAGWSEAPLGASAHGFPLGISAGCVSVSCAWVARDRCLFPRAKAGVSHHSLPP